MVSGAGEFVDLESARSATAPKKEMSLSFWFRHPYLGDVKNNHLSVCLFVFLLLVLCRNSGLC